ncbi:sugar fermentation stimulation protein [Limnospira platensis C1]|nr:sugar fermentation stimulation protein [Arthrospira platensis C1]
MSESLIYSLGELYEGVLIKRYKRLIADIKLNSGEVIVAHCPNTGPMTGVCIPENPVMVSKSDNPNRKLAYTWELIQVGDHQPTWVGINTSLPNRIVAIALQKRLFSQLGDIQR